VLADPPTKKRNRPRVNTGNGINRKPKDPLLEEIRALTRLQFGPQEREIDYARRQSSQYSANLGGWYAQHVNDMKQAQAQQQAFTQGLVQGAYNQANTAAATDTAQNNALTQNAQAQASKFGTQVDPSVAATLQQATQARQIMGTAGGNLLASQGQAQSAYLGNRVGVAGEQGIQAQRDEQNRRMKIEQLAADLAGDKGAFKVKARADITDQRWKRQLEGAAFNQDVREFEAGLQNTRADNRRANQTERRQRRNDRFRRRDTNRKFNQRQGDIDHDNALADQREGRMRAKDKADDGKVNGSAFSPTQVRSGRRTLRNLIDRGRRGEDLPPSHDPLLARAAAQIIRNGGVTPELARKVKRAYGFTPKMKRGLVGNAVETVTDLLEK
jgi:hypothetical protein